MSSRRPVELLRDRSNLRRERNFEVVTPTAKVDDVRVVGVAQDAVEEAITERFAVATEQFEGTTSQRRCGNGNITLHHRRGRPANQVESVFPPQQLSAKPDVVLRMAAGGWLVGDGLARRRRFRRPRSAATVVTLATIAVATTSPAAPTSATAAVFPGSIARMCLTVA